MEGDRDYVVIDGELVLHSTARRDYVCGECYSRLQTYFDVAAPGFWRTACVNNRSHDVSKAIEETTAIRYNEELMAEQEARLVMQRLPAWLQRAIRERK